MPRILVLNGMQILWGATGLNFGSVSAAFIFMCIIYPLHVMRHSQMNVFSYADATELHLCGHNLLSVQ